AVLEPRPRRRAVGRVGRRRRIDEVALTLGIELERPRHMVRIIAGVEMGDDDLAELLLERRAKLVARLAQLREGVALVPGEAGPARLAAAAVLVGEDAAIGGSEGLALVDVRRQGPLLGEVGLDRLDAGGARGRKGAARRDEAIGGIPKVLVFHRRADAQPGRALGRTRRRAGG